jgi:hypothetical protein
MNLPVTRFSVRKNNPPDEIFHFVYFIKCFLVDWPGFGADKSYERIILGAKANDWVLFKAFKYSLYDEKIQ